MSSQSLSEADRAFENQLPSRMFTYWQSDMFTDKLTYFLTT